MPPTKTPPKKPGAKKPSAKKGSGFNTKVGGMPIWAWGALVFAAVGIGLYVRRRSSSSQTTAAQPTADTSGNAGGSGADLTGIEQQIADLQSSVDSLGLGAGVGAGAGNPPDFQGGPIFDPGPIIGGGSGGAAVGAEGGSATSGAATGWLGAQSGIVQAIPHRRRKAKARAHKTSALAPHVGRPVHPVSHHPAAARMQHHEPVKKAKPHNLPRPRR